MFCLVGISFLSVQQQLRSIPAAGFVKVTITVLAPYNAAPHNRYQPQPAEPAQHTTCSNTRLVLLKMGIMMPETC